MQCNPIATIGSGLLADDNLLAGLVRKTSFQRTPPLRHSLMNRVGQMARFGESTRVYVLHGPPEVEQQEALRAIEVEEQSQ